MVNKCFVSPRSNLLHARGVGVITLSVWTLSSLALSLTHKMTSPVCDGTSLFPCQYRRDVRMPRV